MHGASGIPIKGHEKEYATELWLQNPKAFWLHPEGPLSDTTPEEWRAKQPKAVAARRRLDFAMRNGGTPEQQAAYRKQMDSYWDTLLDPT